MGGLPPLTQEGNVTFKPLPGTTKTMNSATVSKGTMGGDHVPSAGAHRSLFGTSKEGVTENSAPPSKSGMNQINGRDAGLDDLDDFFDKKLPSHLDVGHAR